MNFYFVRSVAWSIVHSPLKQKNMRETWWHLIHINVRENLRETYYLALFSFCFVFISNWYGTEQSSSGLRLLFICGQYGIFLRNRCAYAVASSEHLQYHTVKHVCFVMVSTGSLFLPNEIYVFKRVFIFFSFILFIKSTERMNTKCIGIWNSFLDMNEIWFHFCLRQNIEQNV